MKNKWVLGVPYLCYLYSLMPILMLLLVFYSLQHKDDRMIALFHPGSNVLDSSGMIVLCHYKNDQYYNNLQRENTLFCKRESTCTDHYIFDKNILYAITSAVFGFSCYSSYSSSTSNTNWLLHWHESLWLVCSQKLTSNPTSFFFYYF